MGIEPKMINDRTVWPTIESLCQIEEGLCDRYWKNKKGI